MRKIRVKKIAKMIGYKTVDKRQYEEIKGFKLVHSPAYDKPIAIPYITIINKPDTSRARYQFLKRHQFGDI